MGKVFFDKHYNFFKKDSRIYNDEIDRKIDLVIEAVEKGTISKENAVELLRIVLSKELEEDVQFLASHELTLHPKKSLFVFLLNHSSVVERYV
ncbi:hypothetical protein HYV70_02295 [Candidatus Uhrbacteria bacterium]|nr:hypothetical protein [Candidatus Uhrbacteria bacterium]